MSLVQSILFKSVENIWLEREKGEYETYDSSPGYWDVQT